MTYTSFRENESAIIDDDEQTLADIREEDRIAIKSPRRSIKDWSHFRDDVPNPFLKANSPRKALSVEVWDAAHPGPKPAEKIDEQFNEQEEECTRTSFSSEGMSLFRTWTDVLLRRNSTDVPTTRDVKPVVKKSWSWPQKKGKHNDEDELERSGTYNEDIKRRHDSAVDESPRSGTSQKRQKISSVKEQMPKEPVRRAWTDRFLRRHSGEMSRARKRAPMGSGTKLRKMWPWNSGPDKHA